MGRLGFGRGAPSPSCTLASPAVKAELGKCRTDGAAALWTASARTGALLGCGIFRGCACLLSYPGRSTDSVGPGTRGTPTRVDLISCSSCKAGATDGSTSLCRTEGSGIPMALGNAGTKAPRPDPLIRLPGPPQVRGHGKEATHGVLCSKLSAVTSCSRWCRAGSANGSSTDDKRKGTK